jgi:deoxycytidylate deaminase
MNGGAMEGNSHGEELVFALVGPLGTPLDRVDAAVRKSVERHGYTVSPTVRLSRLLEQSHDCSALRPEERRKRLMELGTAERQRHGNDWLAKTAVATIHAWRIDAEGSAPAKRTVHIIHSLKHPDEVRLLRAVYGNAFFLLGASAPYRDRLDHLTRQDYPQGEARRLIDDDSGRTGTGQRTRDTFHLADVFVRVDTTLQNDLDRFVDLVMSHPFLPPTREEHAMFLAYAASLRSSDLSRQVGAVVLNHRGDLISTGAHDVPASGGGPYWPERPDFWPVVSRGGGPDHVRGYDSNERERDRILSGVIQELVGPQPGAPHEVVARFREQLEKTGILDLTEFGRAVHAEVAALLACARAGVSPVDGTLYCTTFPCHNCAKHIVEAGIRRVVYVEPYPKSKAPDLHDDTIVLVDEQEVPDAADRRVRFEVFVGVGARRFVDLFSMNMGSGRPLRRKTPTASGTRLQWERGRDSVPRLPVDPRSYLEREQAVATVLDIDRQHVTVPTGDSAVAESEGQP